MTERYLTTLMAVHDALVLRGVEPASTGFIRGANPEDYMSEQRLRLAREVMQHLPVDATKADMHKLVDMAAPVVARVLGPVTQADHGDDDGGGLRILS